MKSLPDVLLWWILSVFCGFVVIGAHWVETMGPLWGFLLFGGLAALEFALLLVIATQSRRLPMIGWRKRKFREHPPAH